VFFDHQPEGDKNVRARKHLWIQMLMSMALLASGMMACQEAVPGELISPASDPTDNFLAPTIERPGLSFEAPAEDGPFSKLIDTSCAVTHAGQVVCWGASDHPVEIMRQAGRLDDLGPVKTFFWIEGGLCFVLDSQGLRCVASTPEDEAAAAGVEAAFAGRAVIDAEMSSTRNCVLVRDEGPWCWRRTGLTAPLNESSGEVFYLIQGAARVISLAAGTHYFAGLDDEGHAYFWGLDEGTFGRGVTLAGDHRQAVLGAEGMRFQSLDVYSNTCGVDFDGELWCWGRAASLLWTPENPGYPELMPTPADEAFVQVQKTVRLTSAVTESGKIYVWGRTLNAQIGAGTIGETIQQAPSQQMSPVRSEVEFIQVVSANAASVHSSNASCGLSRRGHIYCWGHPYAYGWWSREVSKSVPEPVRAALDQPVRKIAVEATFSCALTFEGQIACWGSNFPRGHGQCLPESEQQMIGTPTVRTDLPALETMVMGKEEICGRRGSAWHCLKNPGNVDQDAFQAVDAPEGGLYGVTTNGATNCGLNEDGRLYCWGDPILHVAPGEFLNPSNGGTGQGLWQIPTPVMPDVRWQEVMLLWKGNSLLCGLTVEDEALCFGWLATAPSNNTTREDGLLQIDLRGENAHALYEAGETVCIRTDLGTIYCAALEPGSPRYVALHPSARVVTPKPIIHIGTLSTSLDSNATKKSICAYGEDRKTRWCLDTRAFKNQILSADGSEGSSTDVLFDQALEVSPLTQLQSGRNFSCGLDSQGYVACYGDDTYGKIGRGLPVTFHQPTLAEAWNAAGHASARGAL
jgi:alpha-tubulin suppressor-like RCC1 family protein